MSAQHARETVAGQHGAFARAAAGHHIVGCAGFQQQGGQKARLDVGQLAGVISCIHAIVDHFVAHGFNHFLQGAFDQAVLGGLTVFINQSNTHGFFVLSWFFRGS